MEMRRSLLILLFLAVVCCTVQATSLHITVTDETNNNGVAGASVRVDGMYKGETNSAGEFVYTHSAEDTFKLTIVKSGYKSWQSMVQPEKSYLTADMSRKNEMLVVSIYDSDNLQPVSGAMVKVTGNDVDDTERSDSSGKANFDVPAHNVYSIEVQADHYEPLYRTFEVGSDSKAVDFRLIRSDLFVVEVSDAEDRLPLSGATVTVDGKLTGTTGEDGRVVCYLEQEMSYLIEVQKDQYQAFSEQHYLSADNLVFPVQLSKALYPVSVSVFDKDKNPVEGAEVYLDSKLLGSTDGYGRCGLATLKAGMHDLEVRCPGYVTWEKKVDLTSGSESLVVELAYSRAHTTIIVEDPEHKVRTGAEVFVNGNSIGNTDENGRITTDLETHETYNFTASLEGYHSEPVVKDISMGSTESSVMITLENNFDLIFIAEVIIGIVIVGGVVFFGYSKFRNGRKNRGRPLKRTQL